MAVNLASLLFRSDHHLAIHLPFCLTLPAFAPLKQVDEQSFLGFLRRSCALCYQICAHSLGLPVQFAAAICLQPAACSSTSSQRWAIYLVKIKIKMWTRN